VKFLSKVDRLAELFEALDTDEGGEAVNYKRLFLEHDDDYNQGMTAETIRSQHLSERLEYLQVKMLVLIGFEGVLGL
jgi:hypothetical protein